MKFDMDNRLKITVRQMPTVSTPTGSKVHGLLRVRTFLATPEGSRMNGLCRRVVALGKDGFSNHLVEKSTLEDRYRSFNLLSIFYCQA